MHMHSKPTLLCFFLFLSGYFAVAEAPSAPRPKKGPSKASPKVEKPNKFLERALELANTGENARAIREFFRALEVDPKDVNIYVGRANAYLRENRPAEAMADLEKAVQLNIKNDNVSLFMLKANLHLSRGEKDKALEELNKVLRVEPRRLDALESRSLMWEQKKDHSRAEVDLNTLMQVQPTNGELYFSSRQDSRGPPKFRKNL